MSVSEVQHLCPSQGAGSPFAELRRHRRTWMQAVYHLGGPHWGSKQQQSRDRADGEGPQSLYKSQPERRSLGRGPVLAPS